MTLTTQEIIRLSHQGYIVRVQREGEVKCSYFGQERWYPAAYLKRVAKPSIWDRVCNWLIGREAA